MNARGTTAVAVNSYGRNHTKQGLYLDDDDEQNWYAGDLDDNAASMLQSRCAQTWIGDVNERE